MIKTVDDYVDRVWERNQDLAPSVVKLMINQGLHMLGISLRNKMEVQFSNAWFRVFFGQLRNNPDELAKHRYIQQIRRLRYNYAKRLTQYDGHYYVGLNESDYQQLKNKIKRNAPLHLTDVTIKKIDKEAFLHKEFKYWLRVGYPVDVGFSLHREKLTIRNYNLHAYRTDNNDIMIWQYKHK